MASDINPIITSVAAIVVLWLAAVTFFLYRAISHYNKLTATADRKTLQSILTALLADITTQKKSVKDLKQKIDTLERSSEYTLKKISLVRFNPFSDTGGEQSFIIGLLDNQNNGILITSLQGRSGTRWYAKRVAKGNGVKYDLSKEEKDAVKKATPLA